MYKAFLEASAKVKVAVIFLLLGKTMFIGTAAGMLISKTVVIISFSLYAFFIFGSITLCLWDGLGKRKKTCAELEKEIHELKLRLSSELDAAAAVQVGR